MRKQAVCPEVWANVRLMMPMVWEHWHHFIGPEGRRVHTRLRLQHERGLLRRKGLHPDQMPASCVSVLSSRGKYSGWQHITFMSSSGMASFPSTLGIKAICGTEATSPGNCGLWKSHWITAILTEACGSFPFLCFLLLVSPFLRTKLISKIKVYIVYTTMNFSQLLS